MLVADARARRMRQMGSTLRLLLARQIRGLTGSTKLPTAYLQPAGDPGLFGPSSITWRVHSHLVSMLVGGLSSLMIQALHPGALAGVWDHSSFRQDLRIRLGRTAHFIASTTYGGRETATEAIERVNHIHERVKGFRPDGKPYSAKDPELLRWVHLAEVISFLKAYCTFGDPSMPVFAQNRYIDEMRRIGQALGATDLPTSIEQAEIQLHAYRPQLIVDDRVREIISLIEQFPARPIDRPFVELIVKAAFDLLPQWVLSELEIPRRPQWQESLTRTALRTISVPIDWSLHTEGVSAYAKRRLQE